MASKEIDAESCEESGFLLNDEHSKDLRKDSERRTSKASGTLIVLLAICLASIATNLWQLLHHQEIFKTGLPGRTESYPV